MAVFVHICRASDLARIRRVGLKVQKRRRGVYAMPVIGDFHASHQWLRELRRWRQGQLVAVYLRLPGDTPVLFGHYNGPQTEGTADQAVAALMQGAGYGFEAIIQRDVAAREILRTRALRPLTGWRYSPSAKGRRPCGCPACQSRGEPFSQRFRRRFEAEIG